MSVHESVLRKKPSLPWPVQSPGPLLVLVILVPPVCRQSHHAHHHHHSQSRHKEDRVAHQHGQLGSQVAPTQGLPLGGPVLLVVVLAAKDAEPVVMVPEQREAIVETSALVAELRLAPVAGHVIAARRALDVDAAERAFLAVCRTLCVLGLCPLLEVLLSLLELPAGGVLVPGGVAAEAPVELACAAGDVDILRPEAPDPFRQLVLRDEAAVGAGFLAAVPRVPQPIPLKLLLGVSGNEPDYLLPSYHPFLALRVGARDVGLALVLDVRPNDLLDALAAHNL